MTVVTPFAAETRFQLDCPDQRARELLATWLEGCHLDWPGTIRFVVHVVDVLPPLPDSREAVEFAKVQVRSGPPEHTIRLGWSLHPAVSLLHPTEPTAELWLTPAALDDFPRAIRTFLLVLLAFTLRRVGWHHVHGAALIDPCGTGWLLTGRSRSGKSTTAALFARQGWKVATDDIGFMVDHEGVVQIAGYREPVALRSGAVGLLQPPSGREEPSHGKVKLWPEELGAAWVPRVTPAILLFPSVGDRTQAVLLDPLSATSMLLRSSPWLLFEPVRAQEHLDQLSRLVGQCRSYMITLGPDLIHDPDLLEAVIRDADTSSSS